MIRIVEGYSQLTVRFIHCRKRVKLNNEDASGIPPAKNKQTCAREVAIAEAKERGEYTETFRRKRMRPSRLIKYFKAPKITEFR